MVTVRPIEEAELEQALPLFAGYQRFYRVPDPNDQRNAAFFRRFIAPSDAGLLLGAFDHGQLIGFSCTYWTFSSTAAADIALMNDLFVSESGRGRGVGRALIEATANAARERGCHHLEWYTATDNADAQRLYDAIGARRSTWYAYEIPLAMDTDPDATSAL